VRIAIDARAAAEVPAGRGRYVREVLLALARMDAGHEYVLIAREPWDGLPDDPRFTWALERLRDPLWVAAAARRARAAKADAVLATNTYLLAALATPSVAVVYDFVAFERELRAPRGSLLERLTLPLAARRAGALACISQATADLLVERIPKVRPKTHVVLLGVQERFFAGAETAAAVRERHGLDRPYVLITGTLEPRKNLVRAIQAFAALPDDVRAGHDLVLAGPRGWATGAIDEAITRNAHLVRALGHVPEDDLPGLYAGATVFLYPSLREGFGLPVVEAMAAGTAVLTSSLSSLPEVGGDAVAYADPYDAGAIGARLEELLTDDGLRAALERKGVERARTFTWERTARETLALLEQVSGRA
jgi:glycosyltransferase involved in cell wall biosynthesis